MKIKFTNTISKKTIDPNQFLEIFFYKFIILDLFHKHIFFEKRIILDLIHKHHIFWVKRIKGFKSKMC